MTFELLIYATVKYNYKAFKHINVDLRKLDKFYFRGWWIVQAGLFSTIYTYFGFTELTIEYLYIASQKDIIRPFILLLDFVLNIGFALEFLGTVILFNRVLTYVSYLSSEKIFDIWTNYFKHLLAKINLVYKRLIKRG